MIRTALALIAAITFASSSANAAKPPALQGYLGADAGHLVVSLAAENGAQAYLLALSYRPVGGTAADYVRFQFVRQPVFGPKPDFGGDAFPKIGLNPKLMVLGMDESKHVDEGVVFVKNLAPGMYEIFDAGGSVYAGGRMLRTFHLATPTSIRFEIKPGQATYIGEFKALPLYSKGFMGAREDEGVRFVVTDQSTRDLPIAAQKEPPLGATQMAIPDVDALNNPVFSSKP